MANRIQYFVIFQGNTLGNPQLTDATTMAVKLFIHRVLCVASGPHRAYCTWLDYDRVALQRDYPHSHVELAALQSDSCVSECFSGQMLGLPFSVVVLICAVHRDAQSTGTRRDHICYLRSLAVPTPEGWFFGGKLRRKQKREWRGSSFPFSISVC